MRHSICAIVRVLGENHDVLVMCIIGSFDTIDDGGVSVNVRSTVVARKVPLHVMVLALVRELSSGGELGSAWSDVPSEIKF
jgi:uncharacterized iron-regulated protein